MRISVITVTFNAISMLKKTVHSVLEQEGADIEYIIIDGGSVDGTKYYLESIEDTRVSFVSEKDEGIYDAMNKGIKMVSGQYIMFMNAGDVFFDKNVIRDIVLEIDDNTSVLYGNAMDVYENIVKENIYPSKLSEFYFLRGNGICHQVMATRTDLLQLYGFNTNYRICADKDFVIKLFVKGYLFKHIDRIICFYDRSGISSSENSKRILLSETKEMLFEYFPIKARFMELMRKVKKKIQYGL